MDNAAKLEVIRQWIDPEERVTVDFVDEKDLSAVITGCTTEYVDLLIQTRFPHIKQTLWVPMREVEVGEDRTHYTRDPERPLQFERLKLLIHQKRPQWA
ncbi:MAG TPA: hypothetical protein VGJ57_01710 [Nitrospirales bacterium]|jgi:hypothetical protein